jgi:hypothetical protein
MTVTRRVMGMMRRGVRMAAVMMERWVRGQKQSAAVAIITKF